MNSADPASLQNLNDIVLPEAVGWWPLASGWYYLFGILLLVVAWFVYVAIRNWNSNRYRRAALHQLRLLAEDIGDSEKRDAALRQVPVLLKRTALSVYPRSQLASLTGKNWLDFLNSKVSTASFTDSTAGLLDVLSYSVGDLNTVDTKTADELLSACRYWLKHHQPDQQQKPGLET
ncbi:MAG: DUF4381 domain-containing protein [Lysobacterales bacterium]